MIEMGKTYKTRDGREVRIYAVDCGEHWPVHGAIKTEAGWRPRSWKANGKQTIGYLEDVDDLIPSDPHGILPRHRELLAWEFENLSYYSEAKIVRLEEFNDLPLSYRCALIALAKQDPEKTA